MSTEESERKTACWTQRKNSSPSSSVADPQLIQPHRGDGVRWLLPWQWNRPDTFSRGLQHPEHGEEHPDPKLDRLGTHRGHQAAQEAPFKMESQLHNEQQLHDRLLLQSPVSTGLPALQHHLLESVHVAPELCSRINWVSVWQCSTTELQGDQCQGFTSELWYSARCLLLGDRKESFITSNVFWGGCHTSFIRSNCNLLIYLRFYFIATIESTYLTV